MEKVEGSIHISHSVGCPYCSHFITDYDEADWWQQHVSDRFPDEDEYRANYTVDCPKCNEKFIIEGFIY